MPSGSHDRSFESFYRSFTPAEQFAPMTGIMPELLAELKRRGLTAFTSHATFCVSRHSSYPEWSEGALVRVWPHPAGLAQVVFDEAESDTDDEAPAVDFRERGELVPYGSLLVRLQPLLDRL